MVKKKIETEKKEEKVSKVLTVISSMENLECMSPSTLARKAGIHPSTFNGKNDEYELAKGISWQNIRNKEGKVKAVLKTDLDLNLRKDISDIKIEILEIKKTLDEIKTGLKK